MLYVPSQKSERSCTRVLEVVMLYVASQNSERSSTRVLEVDMLSVPSQKSTRFSYTVYYIDFQNLLYINFLIRIFHSTRINLRVMILRGSAGRICHLENVKSYM
jgi:hypothetical protein